MVVAAWVGRRYCERLSAVAADVLGALGFAVLLVATGVWIKNPPPDPTRYWWTVLGYFPQTWIYWVLQTASLQVWASSAPCAPAFAPTHERAGAPNPFLSAG